MLEIFNRLIHKVGSTARLSFPVGRSINGNPVDSPTALQFNLSNRLSCFVDKRYERYFYKSQRVNRFNICLSRHK